MKILKRLYDRWGLTRIWPSKRVFSRIYASLKNLDIVLAAVVLLGIGPGLQLIIDASLSQKRDTLYESAYGDYMIVEPSFADAYLSFYSIPFLACAILIAVLSKKKKYQEFALTAAIASFTMWMLYDGILGWLGLTNNPSSFPNVGYNLIGSILFGLSLYLIVLTTRFAVISSVRHVNLLRGFVSLTISTFISLLVTSITGFFLRPIPVSFQTTLAPVTGVYFLPYTGSAKFEPAGHQWEGKEFRSPFPDTPVSRNVTLSGKKITTRLSLDEKTKPYTLKIWLFKGCTFRNPMDITSTEPNIEEVASNRIALSGGQNFSNWVVESRDKMAVRDNTSDAGAFWIDQKSNGIYENSTYIFDKGSVNIVAQGGIMIGVSVLAAKEKNGVISPLPVDIFAANGSKRRVFSLNPAGPVESEEKVPCKQVSEDDFINSVQATIVVGLFPKGSNTSTSIKANVTSEFSYISAKSIKASDVADAYLGVAGLMMVGGESPQLEVKHALPSLAERGEGLIVEGKFDVRTTPQGRVRLSGYATRLWKGEVRVSPTRWESLNDEWQRWILAGAAAVLLAMLRFVSPALWKNRNKPLA